MKDTGRAPFTRAHNLVYKMARGGGRGRGRGTGKGRKAHDKEQQQSRTASPAKKRRRLTKTQGTESSDGNGVTGCSKQRAAKKTKTVTPMHDKQTIVERKKTKKSKTKAMKKSDRDSLLQSLQKIDDKILRCEIVAKLKATFEGNMLLIEFTEVVCSSEQPLHGLMIHHQRYFAAMYVSSKKQQDAYLQFQIDWFKYCSVFLLSEEHSLQDIDYHELSGHEVSALRNTWLGFAKANGVPVPRCNKVMMTISSTVYHFLLDHVARFQQKFLQPETIRIEADDDGVYYRFGGATLCSMLHGLYKDIKHCSDNCKDSLSQKITILQAMNVKDKSCIPGYLQYRDRGFMYFPDPVFILYLREVDSILKEVVNLKGLNEHGDELIKVNCTTFKHTKESHHMNTQQCYMLFFFNSGCS